MQPGAESDHKPQRSARLVQQVNLIGGSLFVTGALFLCVGANFAFALVRAFSAALLNPTGSPVTLTNVVVGLVGMVVSGAAIFLIKLAWDFHNFKSWTFRWVKWYFYSRLTWFPFFVNLEDEEIRKAFDQAK